ncbi:MAG: DUF5060 domain-containing protein [Opitutae bacterium]|nr:DUF5060 domain-containing protein [Opitutae bacterium]
MPTPNEFSLSALRPSGAAVVAWLLGALTAVAASGADHTAVWTRWEQTLTTARDHANPYRDITLRVTYRGPEGQSFSGFGFWDGGRTFKVRAAFPSSGEWQWQTACSDPTDAGLHAHSGHVTVAPYAAENPLNRHGFLKVGANHHHLVHADGTPFLWIGDTPWAAFVAALS